MSAIHPRPLRHAIFSATGELIKDNSADGETLIPFFCNRCKALGGVTRWGDYLRIMKRRRDPANVIAKCKETGEVLVTLDEEEVAEYKKKMDRFAAAKARRSCA